MHIKRIPVEIYVGPYCITEEDGEEIANVVMGLIMDYDVIIIDFNRVKTIAAPFNAALVRRIYYLIFAGLIEFKNMRDIQWRSLLRAAESWHRYQSDPNYKKAVDKMASEITS